MLVLNIKKIMKNKVTVVIFCLISVLVILSIVIYTLSMKLNISRGTNIKNVIERLSGKSNILDMESYYAQLEITVISNKNTNTYSMEEWYKEDVGNKVEYVDSSNFKVSILTLKDKAIIRNENQKNSLMITPYIVKYTNLLSISTFVKIYNESLKEMCCFSANSYEKLDNINMILDNVCKMGEECNCEVYEIVKNVSKIELKLDKKTGQPLTYIVYDNDKKEQISIVYNKFDINAKIEDNIFS